MNKNEITNQQGKSPLKLLAIVILLVVLAIFASKYYKEWQKNPNQESQQSDLILEQQFILTQTDVINTNWLRTLNPLVKNVEGRVVWSNVLQKGVMEFVGLPKIKDNQQYRLWIYDLVGEDTKPIFSTEFSKVLSDKYLIPFNSNSSMIKSPFKFELMLKTEGEETSQPLFLAQP